MSLLRGRGALKFGESLDFVSGLTKWPTCGTSNGLSNLMRRLMLADVMVCASESTMHMFNDCKGMVKTYLSGFDSGRYDKANRLYDFIAVKGDIPQGGDPSLYVKRRRPVGP